MPLSSEAPDLPHRVFSPIARDYDTPALVLSLFRYRAWHRFLLSRLDLPPGARVLDMATGTGAIALDLRRCRGVEVVGGDVTREMLCQAEQRAKRSNVDLDLVECTAEAPPFTDQSFDAITFAYLLRYVSDVSGTLEALGSLLKPGGMMASLDFASLFRREGFCSRAIGSASVRSLARTFGTSIVVGRRIGSYQHGGPPGSVTSDLAV
jgi:ubiquinone/menaquinone biosynthesis C-methylase UbiE